MDKANLYVTTQGTVIGCSHDRLVLRKSGSKLLEMPARAVRQVVIFGNATMTSQAVNLLLNKGIDVAYLSSRGKFRGRLETEFHGNGTLRQQQTRAFLDGMIERQSGKIVNIASDAGRVGSLGETIYSAAKGGVIAFTKSLAREMARYAINVNCVCPGPTDTPLLAREPEKFLEAFKRATPMRRFAKPEEIADAVLFFASERSNFVTGQVLSVSGGLTMVD